MISGVKFDKEKAYQVRDQVKCGLCEYKHKLAHTVPDCVTCITLEYAKHRTYDDSYFKVDFESISAGGWVYGERMVDKWKQAGCPKVYLEKDVGAAKIKPDSILILVLLLAMIAWQGNYWWGVMFGEPVTLESLEGEEVEFYDHTIDLSDHHAIDSFTD